MRGSMRSATHWLANSSADVGRLDGVGSSQRNRTAAAQPVTVDNFIRAEFDLYIGSMVKDGGLENSSTAASRRPSTTRRSSASTATRSIRRRCSTSTPAR